MVESTGPVEAELDLQRGIEEEVALDPALSWIERQDQSKSYSKSWSTCLPVIDAGGVRSRIRADPATQDAELQVDPMLELKLVLVLLH